MFKEAQSFSATFISKQIFHLLSKSYICKLFRLLNPVYICCTSASHFSTHLLFLFCCVYLNQPDIHCHCRSVLCQALAGALAASGFPCMHMKKQGGVTCQASEWSHATKDKLLQMVSRTRLKGKDKIWRTHITCMKSKISN